jgi:hypothetical protein
LYPNDNPWFVQIIHSWIAKMGNKKTFAFTLRP